jgi:hypothetical protein
MTTRHLLMAFAAPMALIAVPADAAIFTFTVTGSIDAAFTIDSGLLSPPAEYDDTTFTLTDVAGTFRGISRRADAISFNTLSWDGGLTIQLGDAFLNLWGSQLFTGSTAAPVLTTGTFTMLEDGDADFVSTLTIDEVTAAVPEPASWALMIVGMGAIGYTMRRRRATVRLQAA